MSRSQLRLPKAPIIPLSILIQSIVALPYAQAPPRPHVSIVNVDGSSEPSYTPPAIIEKTATVAQMKTVDVGGYQPPPSATITVTTTATPSSSSKSSSSQSSSTLSSSPQPKFDNFTTSSSVAIAIPTSSSSIPIIMPLATLSSSPHPESYNSTTASSIAIAIPTPSSSLPIIMPLETPSSSSAHPLACNATKPTISSSSLYTPSTSSAPLWDAMETWTKHEEESTSTTTSYSKGAHAPMPSGMTAPLPELPEDSPQWVNRTQVPGYQGGKAVDDED